MAAFTPEDLRRLRETVKLRSEQLERRKREIDVLRRAAWLRMDLLREDGALGPPGVAPAPHATVPDPRQAQGVALYPPAVVREKGPGAAAGEPSSAALATTGAALHDAAPGLGANRKLAPAR